MTAVYHLMSVLPLLSSSSISVVLYMSRLFGSDEKRAHAVAPAAGMGLGIGCVSKRGPVLERARGQSELCGTNIV